MNRRLAALALAVSTAAVPTTASRAAAEDQPIAAAARAVLDTQRSNVVTVRLAARVRIGSAEAGSMDMDLVIEASGFLLDPAGLVVTSLNATDPRELYEQYLNDGEGEDYTLSTEIARTTIVFDGGQEAEAEAGLRDTDLDLAYFTLKAPAPIGSAVRKPGAAPKAFDSVVILRRLGEVAGRTCAGALTQIHATVERPRTFYIVSNDSAVGLGEPAFDLDGNCLGVVTLRAIKPGSTPTEYLFSGEDPYSTVIVLPLAQVLDGARQHKNFEKLAE